MPDAKADAQEMVIVLASWQPYIHVLDSIVNAHRVRGTRHGRSMAINLLHLASSPPDEGKILILQ